MPETTASAASDTSVATLEPAFDDGVVVVLSANERYVPYVSVVLQSIKENADPARNYDVVVLNTDISLESQERLIAQVSSENFSLRFYSAMPIMKSYSHLRVYGHFKIETYYRLIVPQIMPHSQKAVYLDSDLVVLTDVARLYDVEMGDNLIAATHDADTAGMYNGYDPDMKAYIDNVLKLDNPYDYFQAGVLVMNLEAFRARYTTREMLECAASRHWNLLDQDVLNYLARGSVCYVDMAWNTLMDWEHLRRYFIIGLAPMTLREAYEKARRHPYIVHYAGPDNKPWEYRDADMGAYFWDYASRCPYCEQLSRDLEAAVHSSAYRLQRIGHFWLYQIIMRSGQIFAPPRSQIRATVYQIYHLLGGKN
ncbi:MAG: glycosyltransferase family 8 protein [Eggerthellaceae bacterium]